MQLSEQAKKIEELTRKNQTMSRELETLREKKVDLEREVEGYQFCVQTLG